MSVVVIISTHPITSTLGHLQIFSAFSQHPCLPTAQDQLTSRVRVESHSAASLAAISVMCFQRHGFYSLLSA